MSFVVLVLASGRGERFLASGGAALAPHKLQAQLQGQTVLQRTLDAVRASGLPWHLEQASHPGMGDCIAAAVRAASLTYPDAQGWLILPADLPLIQPDTLRRVAGAPAAWPVVRPVHQGEAGHPVRFGRACTPDLLALRGDAGAAAVARQHGPARQIDVDDVGCVTDIDTVNDLARAEALLRARH
ncbi:nucleotidyltransferase family protein [Hylemonella gracilis]|jgi:molybdenum cofactor cytidylyltransferase|uniref:Nucleotidyltransferase family protein n=1 Tax=Hylemonella gracilis TaxID=80880 RepID=A0A4P6UM93_9BURK|nr:nucleotidyltransferase family protein [Hylemonella gracilis]QBK04631.1 nucleotidyltransferase family protein [Hylemonella gracilis]